MRLRRTPPEPGVWWQSPVWITLIIIPISVASVALAEQDTFFTDWRSAKSITPTATLTFLAEGLTLALGAAIALSFFRRRAMASWPLFDEAQLRVLCRASTVLFVLTSLGYLAFVVAGIRAGLTLDVLLGYFTDAGSGVIENKVATIGGVTTATQFGVASTTVSAILIALGVRRRRELGYLTGVMVLSTLRAVFYTERLALIEVVVPVLLVLAGSAARRSARKRRTMVAMPAILGPAVFAIFSIFEYTRSWTFYAQRYNGAFLDFAAQRFFGYYATAYNNGYLLITYATPAGRWPSGTWAAFWSAPGIKQIDLLYRLSGYDPDRLYDSALRLHGNPEFNNPSGIAQAMADYGTAGAAVYFFVAGAAFGALYAAFVASRPVGVLLYPIAFLGILEIPRYMYWAEGRAVPAVVSLAIIAYRLSRARPAAAADGAGDEHLQRPVVAVGAVEGSVR